MYYEWTQRDNGRNVVARGLNNLAIYFFGSKIFWFILNSFFESIGGQGIDKYFCILWQISEGM